MRRYCLLHLSCIAFTSGSINMPTYEYVCHRCGHHFDRFQKMSDEPIGKCPECGGPVERLIGIGSAVIFVTV